MALRDDVELQPIPPEAMENGTLRDGIAERLERLRQAPHARLAHLLDVREMDGKWFLAWEKIPGRSLADSSVTFPEDRLYGALGELIDAVEGLHQLGLVHGNLRSENVMIADDGVYVTNASPLLWTDEQIDIAAVGKIMRETLQGRRLPVPGPDMQSLRALAAFLDGGYLPDVTDDGQTKRLDRRALAWAIVLLLLAITLAAAIAWYFQRPTAQRFQSAAFHVSQSMHV